MLLPTPTSNQSLPINFGQFDTIVDGLEYAAGGETGCNFYSVRGKLVDRVSYRDLRDQAVTLAKRLRNLELPRVLEPASLRFQRLLIWLLFEIGNRYGLLRDIRIPRSFHGVVEEFGITPRC